ncbi:MAG TPA: NAD-dependent epimerase/dehydratase family protein [Acidimicrobiia bacterium]|nr:NAD-dependent epimerase/dehydratase family protein [Acidimicrobiia bacterium]
MRVVVTGAAGFIGAHAADGLRAGGHSVVGLDLRTPGEEHGDIRQPLDPGRLAGADVVVHLAALAGVVPSFRRPAEYHDTNVVGTANVLGAAKAAGVPRVVMASSSSIYGECDGPASERRAPAPLSPYASTKVAAEALAASHASRTMEVLVVRPFTVFGPGQRPDMLVARMLSGERLTLWEFERDFTPVAAVARALVAGCTVDLPAPYTVVNLGAGRPVAAHDLLDAVADVTGHRPAVTWGAARSGEPVRTWADRRWAERLLGFEADGLHETLALQYDAMRGARVGPLEQAG